MLHWDVAHTHTHTKKRLSAAIPFTNSCQQSCCLLINLINFYYISISLWRLFCSDFVVYSEWLSILFVICSICCLIMFLLLLLLFNYFTFKCTNCIGFSQRKKNKKWFRGMFSARELQFFCLFIFFTISTPSRSCPLNNLFLPYNLYV